VNPSIIVHGGSGSVPPDAAVRQAACDRAADAAFAILQRGGTALDAVEHAICVLEDDPSLNAGTGSDLQADGVVRMDASLMGSDGRAGAVAQVPGLRNPIRLARYILEQDAHIMVCGPEALKLGQQIGLESGPLATEAKIAWWREHLDGPGRRLDYAAMAEAWKRSNAERLGTVGAVAVDSEGRLMAGTSTGGTALCYPGRIGDTPVIGAGTFCTRLAGVSMTGLGERMMVLLSAKRFCDVVHSGLSIDRAARVTIEEIGTLTHGVAGLIAVDLNGGIVSMHDTPFMVTAQRR
jgi:beta-aspartyl-peptidase (threonine type)